MDALLTLKASEVKQNGASSTHDGLMLMQLPPDNKTNILEQLHSARIVGPPVDRKRGRQACLVLEDQSFTLHKVETSNVLVLLAPADDKVVGGSTNDATVTNKKRKTTAAHLLRPGGSGASFLQLTKREVPMEAMLNVLKAHVYEPDNSTSFVGCTAEQLALELQCAELQVRQTLSERNTIFTPNDVSYGILSEEVSQDAIMAIVAALNEYDDFVVGKELCKSLLIKEALKRSPDGMTERVLRHCLETDLLDEKTTSTDDVQCYICHDKLAVVLAHFLFNSRSEPWEESDFLLEWERKIPGTNTSSDRTHLLKGLAVRVKDKLVYLPKSKLPSSMEERAEILFHHKPQWTLEELEAYGGSSLLKYTQKRGSGKPAEIYYLKKR